MLPDFEYKYNDEILKYMKEQIWEAKNDISLYHKIAPLQFVHFYDEIGTPKDVLEVGSGLGRGTIYLNHLLNDDSVSYTLADRTGYTTNSGAFNPSQDEFYNDLDLTKQFCEMNGLKNVETFDTELDDWGNLKKFDLIFSICSFGMHVKIERYMDRLLSVSKESTIMIFGVRHSSYTCDSFLNQFKSVNYKTIAAGPENPTRENWLILKNPKI
jgi:SAM-dependent methyltransferase